MCSIDVDAFRWTLSSLLQGLCAIYGLVLVFYVYFRSATEKHCRELHDDIRRMKREIKSSAIDPSTEVTRERHVIEIAIKYDQARRVRKNERALFRGFRVFSLAFVVVIFLDFVALGSLQRDIQWNLEDIGATLACLSYWLVALSTALMIVVLGAYSTWYFHTARRDTKAKDVRDRGIDFFMEGFDQHATMREGPRIDRKEQYREFQEGFEVEKKDDCQRFFRKD